MHTLGTLRQLELGSICVGTDSVLQMPLPFPCVFVCYYYYYWCSLVHNYHRAPAMTVVTFWQSLPLFEFLYVLYVLIWRINSPSLSLSPDPIPCKTKQVNSKSQQNLPVKSTYEYHSACKTSLAQYFLVVPNYSAHESTAVRPTVITVSEQHTSCFRLRPFSFRRFKKEKPY